MYEVRTYGTVDRANADINIAYKQDAAGSIIPLN